MLKKPTIIETIRLNRLRWFGHVLRMEQNAIPKRVLYMNFGKTWLRCRPRNRWQDEVREDGRIVGGEGWQKKVYNRDEGRSSWEQQGIIAFCTHQWNERINQFFASIAENIEIKNLVCATPSLLISHQAKHKIMWESSTLLYTLYLSDWVAVLKEMLYWAF